MAIALDRSAEDAEPFRGHSVELVFWPEEALRRDHLAQAGVPRLLVVAPDAKLPDPVALDEDWVREPVADADVSARVERLHRLTAALHHDRPHVDEQHVLHRGQLTARLRATYSRLEALLLDHGVVSRDELRRQAWPAGATVRPGAVDAAVSRLRKRLRGMGMQVRPVRGRGYELHVDAGDDRAAIDAGQAIVSR